MPGPTPPEQPKPGERFGSLRKRYEPVRPLIKSIIAAGLEDHDPSDIRALRRGAFLTAEQLNPLVYKDPLTELNNKRWFGEEMKRKMAEADRDQKPLWILTLDIDDFKKFNSQYGHPGGDAVLKAMAKLPFRKEEPIARIGGDEFSELLHGISEQEIIIVVKRYIEEMIKISQELDLHPIKEIPASELAKEITLTFGLAQYQAAKSKDEKGESPEDFEKRANLAMHEAKNRGKNRIIIAEKTTDPENPTYRDLEL